MIRFKYYNIYFKEEGKMHELDKKEVNKVRKDIESIKKEVGKIIIGQDSVINAFFKGLLCDGNMMIEGVPGIAKTLLIRAMAAVTSCKFNRIQFTADLLPTDITGIIAYEPKKGFYTLKGPIFSNFILADEINRSPGKTQSSLLEAMQERQVTIGRETFHLERPFFVLATLNPIETFGTYPLPEAQIDRFLFKILMDYPKKHEEINILKKNIDLKSFNEYNLRPVVSNTEIIRMQEMTKRVYLAEEIEKYIVELVNATRKPSEYKIKMGKYIKYGSSPRAGIGLYIGAKANALMKGKTFVTPQDVKDIAYDVFRHRLIFNYEGQAEGIKPEDYVTELLLKVPIP